MGQVFPGIFLKIEGAVQIGKRTGWKREEREDFHLSMRAEAVSPIAWGLPV